MPIYPRYEGSSNVASPDTPLNPTEDIRSKQLGQLGHAVEGAGLAGMTVAQKVKKLERDTLAIERYMGAVSEMEAFEETLRGDNAEDARKKFSAFQQSRQADWYKGLDKEGSFALETKLFPKTMEYQSGAAKIENRYKVDRFSATLIQGEKQLVQGINRGRVLGDPEQSDEYKTFAQQIDNGVSLGLINKEEGAKQKFRVLQNGSYDAAYRLMIDAPEEYIKLDDQDKKEKGGTFLKNIPDKERAQLKGQAEERIRSKRNEEWSILERANTLRERKEKELREAAEIDVEKRLRGDKDTQPMTIQELDMLGGSTGLRLLSGEKYRFYRDAMTNNLIQGTYYDEPTLARDLGLRVDGVNDSASNVQEVRSLKAEVMKAVTDKKLTFKTGTTWLRALDEKEKSESSPLNRQSNDAKALVKQWLTTTGPMQAPKELEKAVLGEALTLVVRNQYSPNPEPPLELIERHRAEWQSRVGVPGRRTVNEARRAEGLGPSPKDGAPDTLLDTKARALGTQYQQMPPGPAKDALAEKLRRLRLIEKLQQENASRFPPKSGAETVAPKSGGGYTAPVTNPTRE